MARRHLAPVSLLLFAVGCSSGPPPADVCPNLQRLSKDTWRIYKESMADWSDAHSVGLHGSDLHHHLQGVYSRLETALEASKYSELILTKMAEVLLEAGTVNDPQAERLLKDVIDECPDWAPAWYLLAWMELREENATDAQLDAAQHYIEQFEVAMDRVIAWSPAPGDPGYAPAPEQPGFYDERLSDFDRRMEFLHQMSGYLSWSKTNELLTRGVKEINVEEMSSGGVFNALKARAKYLKLLINDRKLDRIPDAAAKVDRWAEMTVILQDQIEPLDYDFYHARKRRAELLYLIGEYSRAAKVTSTLIDTTNPMLANDPDLVYLAVQIHSDWIIEKIRALPDTARIADDGELRDLFAHENNYSVRLLGSADGGGVIPGVDPAHFGGHVSKIEFLLEVMQHARASGDDSLYHGAVDQARGFLASADQFASHPDDRRVATELRQRFGQLAG